MSESDDGIPSSAERRPSHSSPFLRAPTSERRIGLRASTRFPVLVCEGPGAAHCHALELSATGVVVDRGRSLNERELRAGFKLELFLPNLPRPVRALAKVARTLEPGIYAFKFGLISDVDRLTLMEHLDHMRLDSLSVLRQIEEAGAA